MDGRYSPYRISRRADPNVYIDLQDMTPPPNRASGGAPAGDATPGRGRTSLEAADRGWTGRTSVETAGDTSSADYDSVDGRSSLTASHQPTPERDVTPTPDGVVLRDLHSEGSATNSISSFGAGFISSVSTAHTDVPTEDEGDELFDEDGGATRDASHAIAAPAVLAVATATPAPPVAQEATRHWLDPSEEAGGGPRQRLSSPTMHSLDVTASPHQRQRQSTGVMRAHSPSALSGNGFLSPTSPNRIPPGQRAHSPSMAYLSSRYGWKKTRGGLVLVFVS